MSKYYLTYSFGGGFQESFNALGKAREDVIKTLRANGWEDFQIKGTGISKLLPQRLSSQAYKLSMIVHAWMKSFRLSKGDRIIYQYPDYQCIDKYIIPMFRRRKALVEVIIHDLDYMRSEWHTWEYEAKILSYCDVIYVHNESMFNLLEDNGIPRAKMRPITLFDYYSSDPINHQIIDEEIMKRISFAGNLSKSRFLYDLNKISNSSDIHFKLYGIPVSDLEFSQGIEYAGKFSPELTGYISAGWGLVWDGDSIETCTGTYGQYLKYNSSHKLSLYLACGIPVIVWSGSAMAKWVIGKKVGIAVNSLNELPVIINGFSEEQYAELTTNAYKFGGNLRKGYYLSKALGPEKC